MAATAPEIVAAQRVVPDPLLDRSGGWCIPCAHESYREHYCLPKRAIPVDIRRVDRKAPYEPSVGIDRPFCERHRRGLFDAALSDRGHHLVAGSEELASQSYRELGVAICAHQLGPAQRAWILVFLLGFVMGSLWDLFCFPAMVCRPAPPRSR